MKNLSAYALLGLLFIALSESVEGQGYRQEYFGRSKGTVYCQQSEALTIWISGNEVSANYWDIDGFGEGRFRHGRVRVKIGRNGHRIFFLGKVSEDALTVTGRLIVFNRKGRLVNTPRYTLYATEVPGRVTLSGLTLCSATTNGTARITGSTGAAGGAGGAWDTFGIFNNLILFTNRGEKRIYLNGGVSDMTRRPNQTLAPGMHTFYFAVSGTSVGTDLAQFNLFFNDDRLEGIFALVGLASSTAMRAVPEGITTWHPLYWNGGHTTGTGSLSLKYGDLTVTLRDLRITQSSADNVADQCVVPDKIPDVEGMFTVEVSKIPSVQSVHNETQK